MKEPTKKFKVITDIIWKDMNDNIIETWKAGDIVDGYCPLNEESPSYYVTSMGPVWADELILMSAE